MPEQEMWVRASQIRWGKRPDGSRNWMRVIPASSAPLEQEATQALHDENEANFERAARLETALDRLLGNAEHIFDKQPVRDWDETLCEARAALDQRDARLLRARRRQRLVRSDHREGGSDE